VISVHPKSSRGGEVLSGLICAGLVLVFSIAAYAQGSDSEIDDAPPPMRIASKEERDRLATAADAKARTKVVIELMDARIKLAEDAVTRPDPNAVHRELGGFHFLMDDALQYLIRRDVGNSSSGNNFKRYELALRAFAPRIELIRREMPLAYEQYVLSVLKRLREARTRAVEPLFAN